MLGDVPQVLIVSDYGIESFDPASGTLLWEHPWKLDGIFRVCQPLVLPDQRVLVATGMTHGTRQVRISHQGLGWGVTEEWTCKDLKPYFNDFVSHAGSLYGFDGQIFSCIDLATGKKRWQKGRYGHGQVLLAADQGLLVVISETGELILIEANPQKLVELSRFQALTGKTWNHPVIAGDKLIVRNDAEMACFVLAGADGG
jgi:outer membrane protein assembly factor BamB